jgi:hypothetical protein
MISSQGDFANEVARTVAKDINLASMRRSQLLSPGLFSGVYEYAAPNDLKSSSIIDIPAQAKRSDGSFTVVPSEQFAVSKEYGDIAVSQTNGVKQLLINSQLTDVSEVVSTLESVSANGAWSAFGDAENVNDDIDDYIVGSGSVTFGISAAGGTTAGIENSTIDQFDVTDFLGGNSSLFVYVKINSATGITNFTMRLGSSSSNYYTKTVTARHDGTAFVSGWNLLRFDLSSMSETGSVVDYAIDYCALFMTKDASKVSETSYKFNYAVIKRGVIHKVVYQSNYPWVTAAGVYKLNSTDDADIITANPEEYSVFVLKGIAIGKRRTDFTQKDIKIADDDYKESVKLYMMDNPDEVKTTISSYHTYG